MSFPTTFRSVLTRFLPAATTVFAAVLGLIALAEPRGLSLTSFGVIATELLMLTSGFTLVTTLLRPRSSQTNASSRSHAIAGLLAPIGLAALSPFAQGTNWAGITAISLATGVVVGFVHWVVTSRKSPSPGPTLEEQEAAVDAELARLDSGSGLNSPVISISRPEKTPRHHSEQVA